MARSTPYNNTHPQPAAATVVLLGQATAFGTRLCDRNQGCMKPLNHTGFCSGHKGVKRQSDSSALVAQPPRKERRRMPLKRKIGAEDGALPRMPCACVPQAVWRAASSDFVQQSAEQGSGVQMTGCLAAASSRARPRSRHRRRCVRRATRGARLCDAQHAEAEMSRRGCVQYWDVGPWANVK